MKSRRWQMYFTIPLVLFLFILPTFIHSPRYISLFDQLFFNIILVMGVFSVWTVGLINAAQPVFFGLGAYTAALLMMRFHWPFWLVFPFAGIIPAIIAALFGWVGLKLKGAYFLFFTIALCELIQWIWLTWINVFNGAFGLFPIPQPHINIFSFHINFGLSLTPYYYLTLILVVVTCLFYFKIHGSRLGRVLQSVNLNEDLLANTGISVFSQKLIVIVVSCFFAGLAGAVYAPYMKVVSPTQFTLYQGIWIVLGALVGGMWSPIGAIVGTVFMAVLNVFLMKYTNAQPLVLGLLLVLVLLFMPSGLFGSSGEFIKRIKELTGHKLAPLKTIKKT